MEIAENSKKILNEKSFVVFCTYAKSDVGFELKYNYSHYFARQAFESQIVATATKDELIEVVKKQNGWFKVKYNNQLGWLTGNNFQFHSNQAKHHKKSPEGGI